MSPWERHVYAYPLCTVDFIQMFLVYHVRSKDRPLLIDGRYVQMVINSGFTVSIITYWGRFIITQITTFTMFNFRLVAQ